MEYELPFVEESMIPLPDPPGFIDYAVSWGIKGEAKVCCCSKDPVKYSVEGSAGVFGTAEVGYTAGLEYHRNLKDRYYFEALIGIRASGELELSGNATVEINPCTREVAVGVSVESESTIAIEVGIRGELKQHASKFNWGIDATVGGSAKAKMSASMKCNSEECILQWMHWESGNLSLDTNLTLGSLNYTFNIWETEKPVLFEYDSPTQKFPSPFHF